MMIERWTNKCSSEAWAQKYIVQTLIAYSKLFLLYIYFI